MSEPNFKNVKTILKIFKMKIVLTKNIKTHFMFSKLKYKVFSASKRIKKVFSASPLKKVILAHTSAYQRIKRCHDEIFGLFDQGNFIVPLFWDDEIFLFFDALKSLFFKGDAF